MRVDVLRVLDPEEGIVFFSCEAGSASGRWMGEHPVEAGSFHVEFDIPDEVVEWTVAARETTVVSGAPGSDVTVECTVEGVNDDLVEVRLGPDIVLIEVPHRRPELTIGAQISFRTPEIRLYPYDL